MIHSLRRRASLLGLIVDSHKGIQLHSRIGEFHRYEYFTYFISTCYLQETIGVHVLAQGLEYPHVLHRYLAITVQLNLQATELLTTVVQNLGMDRHVRHNKVDKIKKIIQCLRDASILLSSSSIYPWISSNSFKAIDD